MKMRIENDDLGSQVFCQPVGAKREQEQVKRQQKDEQYEHYLYTGRERNLPAYAY
ncbi:MAG: hypothetical protein PVG32_10750 [Anaerolineales bacterium]|jgi:hypothetical protein